MSALDIVTVIVLFTFPAIGGFIMAVGPPLVTLIFLMIIFSINTDGRGE